MAIFKKLNIGATVATSGARVFKKLTTEDPLPIWDGTDLSYTTWEIPAGWTAEAGYGEFDIGGFLPVSSGGQFGFSSLCIGFENPSGGIYETNITAAPNSIIIFTMVTGTKTPDETFTLRIFGGTDTTNPRLISWLLKNAKLTSHQLVINGTYRLNDTITELPIVYADGENISYQSTFNVGFYIGTSPSAGLFCMQEADGITLHPMPTLSVYYLYDFRTNTWRKDELRNFTFDNATATNHIGEDVTQVLLWWIVTNATKQDSQ